MKYKDAIFMCLDYIEKHIKEELTLDILASVAGYSPFHFSRIFKDKMGVSIMEYVKERKLVYGSKEMFEGKKIIDVAIAYGYETHSGFTKAFKKKFGFAPTLIYAMRMSCDLLNENGGVFMKKTTDFTEPEVLYKELVQSIETRGLGYDLHKIEKAYEMACVLHQGEYRKSGEPYIIHPLCVASILVEMEAGEACIIAGMLHEVMEKNTAATLEEVRKEFSDTIAKTIKEVTRLNEMRLEELGEEMSDLTNTAILIKLADRLHNMRTIKYMEPEKLKKKAEETIQFFSPIAAKLGISKMKAELDDLAVSYL